MSRNLSFQVFQGRCGRGRYWSKVQEFKQNHWTSIQVICEIHTECLEGMELLEMPDQPPNLQNPNNPIPQQDIPQVSSPLKPLPVERPSRDATLESRCGICAQVKWNSYYSEIKFSNALNLWPTVMRAMVKNDEVNKSWAWYNIRRNKNIVSWFNVQVLILFCILSICLMVHACIILNFEDGLHNSVTRKSPPTVCKHTMPRCRSSSLSKRTSGV